MAQSNELKFNSMLGNRETYTKAQIDRFIGICLDISAERDREKLLTVILDTIMDIANCDAGTLYLLEGDGLHFCRMKTRSLEISQGGHDSPISLPPVPLDPEYISAWTVVNKQSINIEDVRTDSRFDFSGSARYDEMTGYHTRTMLVVPMTNDRGEVIGAAQLINAMDDDGTVIRFTPALERLITAAASQAAVSITNMKYAESNTALLDSLVGALSTAIDQRSPYNANHTRNMVTYATRFLDWINAADYGWRFDEDCRRTFLLSVWLHDVGKLIVPLEVMDKPSRLGDQTDVVLTRIGRIKLLARIAWLEGKIDEKTYNTYRQEAVQAAEFIEKINTKGFLSDEDLGEIRKLSAKTYTEEDGSLQRWITDAETVSLSVRKGTLTEEERGIMESHVVSTRKILESVAFPHQYEKVPVWAGMHHETLNGKGYPDRLPASEIPKEVRLLTIIDIFDALTAQDRPYKPAMPVEKALGILGNMADEGLIDKVILSMFTESKVWENKEQ